MEPDFCLKFDFDQLKDFCDEGDVNLFTVAAAHHNSASFIQWTFDTTFGLD